MSAHSPSRGTDRSGARLISRRSFLATSSVPALAAWFELPRSVRAAAPPSGTFADVRGGVSTFLRRGGTIGVFIAEGALVVIDSQFPDTAQACLEGVRQRSSRRLDALFNTHHHADHTAGNRVFREMADRIVAHANVPALQRKAAEGSNLLAEQVYADTTFTDRYRLPVGSEVIIAKHYGPAHTGGDAVIFFERANVAHMGDLVFNRMHPYIDRPAGASIRNWVVTLEKVTGEHDADTRYIFGHAQEGFGVVGAKADLLTMRDYLSALIEAAETAARKGTAREEFTKTRLPEAFAVYDPKPTPANPNPRFGLPMNLGIAFDEVSAGK